MASGLEVLAGGAFLVASTTIPSLVGARRAKKVQETLGQKNGKGTVVQMAESLVDWSREHQLQDLQQFELIQENQKRMEAEQDRVRRELADLKRTSKK